MGSVGVVFTVYQHHMQVFILKESDNPAGLSVSVQCQDIFQLLDDHSLIVGIW